jgi:hypothetical protein
MRQQGARDAIDAEDIGVEHATHLLLLEFFQCADDPIACIVDEHINAAGLGERKVDGLLDRRWRGHVERHGERPIRVSAGKIRNGRRIASAAYDGLALRQQSRAQGASKPAGTAGHQPAPWRKPFRSVGQMKLHSQDPFSRLLPP